MSLTRSMLKGMGLTEEQVSAIIEEHTSVTNALKEERDAYKKDAAKLPAVQKELDALKAGDGNDWEKKYNDEHDAFEKYKKDVNDKETLNSIKAAYRKLLKEANIDEKRFDTITRVTDFSKMKLTKDGALEGAEDLTKAIEKDWADFVVTTGKKGADVDNTGNNGTGKPMTKNDIMAIKDTAERQKAIAEHIDLFTGH